MTSWRCLIAICMAAAILNTGMSSPYLSHYDSSERDDSDEHVSSRQEPDLFESQQSALRPEQAEATLPDQQHGALLEAEKVKQITPGSTTRATIILTTEQSNIEISPTPATEERVATTEEPQTTTTTPQPLAQYEIQTRSLITQNQDSMNKLQLDMVRYDTQLNLNTLDTILPVLEVVRENMSALLRTPHESLLDFEAQSDTLQEELVLLERRINQNRAIQQRYAEMERETRRQLGVVQKSLGEILSSQVQVLSPELVSTEGAQVEGAERTDDEIKEYFTESEMNNFPLDHNLNYLKSLTTPRNRLLGYGLLSNILMERGQNSPVLVAFARDLFIFPELEELQEQLPETVKMIFSRDGKVIEMRPSSRQLTVVAGSAVTSSLGRSVKPWAFYPVEDGLFYIIRFSVTNQTLGVVDSVISTPSDRFKRIKVATLSEALTDQSYHWKIHPISTGGSTYLKFVNRATGMALDANSDGPVYPHSVNDGVNQHWELH